MTSSTKPEVRNVSQRRPRSTEPRPQVICNKHFNEFSHAVLELCERKDKQTDKSYGTMRHVRSGENTHCRRVGNRRNFAYFFPLAPKVWEIGDPKRLTRVRGQVPTKFGCDRSIVVGCVGRGMTDRRTDKQNGMTIRLTLCERDATCPLGLQYFGLVIGQYGMQQVAR